MHYVNVRELTKVEEGDEYTRDDSSVLEQILGEECKRSKLWAPLPEKKEEYADDANYQHGNDAPVVPASLRRGRQSERNQNQADGRGQEEQSKNVQLKPESLDNYPRGLALEDAWWQATLSFRLSLIQEQDGGERQEAKGQNNGPDAVAPSPGRILENALGNRRAGPDSPQEGNIEESGEERSVEQIGGVGDEYLLENLQPLRAGSVENLCGRIGLDVPGRRLLNISNCVDEDCKRKGFKSAKDVCNL
jgi:hypothetical protein